MLYCEAGDMYSRIRSTKEKGETFKESQILDWIAQTVTDSPFRAWPSTTCTIRKSCTGT